MILKAFITKLPDIGDNIFEVRIPYFEDNTSNKAIYKAALCIQPGMYGGYSVGDCVFVCYNLGSKDIYNPPVIIGKLYIDTYTDNTIKNSITADHITVNTKIDLPADTNIGGYNTKDFFQLYQQANQDKLLYDIDDIFEDE